MSFPTLRTPSTSKNRTSSSSDWLGTLIIAAKTMTSVGECLPFPFVKGLFGTSVVLLELVEKVGTNKGDLRDLAESVVDIMEIMRDELETHGEASAPRFKAMCEDFTKYLDKIVQDLGEMQCDKPVFGQRLKKYINVNSIGGQISDYRRCVDELRTNFALVTAAGTRLELSNVQQEVAVLRSEFKSEVSSIPRRIGNPTPFDEDFPSFLLGEIELIFPTERKITIRKRDPENQCGITIGAVIDYNGRIGGGTAVKTVRIFQGGCAHELWERSLNFYANQPRHPHLPQLFGMCKSPRFQALVFHEDLVSLDDYVISLESPVLTFEFECRLIHDRESALKFLGGVSRTAIQEMEILQYALVKKSTGRICIPYLPHYHNTIIKMGQPWRDWFMLHHLPSHWYSNLILPVSRSTLGPYQTKIAQLMSHYDILSTLYCLGLAGVDDPRVGGLYLWNGYQTHLLAHIPFPRRLVTLTWETLRPTTVSQAPASMGWTRFDIPLTIFSAMGFDTYLESTAFTLSATARVRIDPRQLHRSWLAQAQHTFTASNASHHGWQLNDICSASVIMMHLLWELELQYDPFSLEGTFMAPGTSISLPDRVFLFVEDPPVHHDGRVGAPRIYWETDSTTTKAEMLRTGTYLLTASVHFKATGCRWESRHYHILGDFHRECGINPGSNEAAILLDLPLAQLSSAPVAEKSPFASSDWEDARYPRLRASWKIREELGSHTALTEHIHSEFTCQMPPSPSDIKSVAFALDRDKSRGSNSSGRATTSVLVGTSLNHDDLQTDDPPLCQISRPVECGYTLANCNVNCLLVRTWTAILVVLLIGGWAFSGMA